MCCIFYIYYTFFIFILLIYYILAAFSGLCRQSPPIYFILLYYLRVCCIFYIYYTFFIFILLIYYILAAFSGLCRQRPSIYFTEWSSERPCPASPCLCRCSQYYVYATMMMMMRMRMMISSDPSSESFVWTASQGQQDQLGDSKIFCWWSEGPWPTFFCPWRRSHAPTASGLGSDCGATLCYVVLYTMLHAMHLVDFLSVFEVD